MNINSIAVDWRISLLKAQEEINKISLEDSNYNISTRNNNLILTGNIDPIVLYGTERNIRNAVKKCVSETNGIKHVLNLGHGVEKDIPEESVAIFVDEAKNSFCTI